MASFFVYLLGTALVLGALIYGSIQLGIPTTWVVVIGLLVVGFGVRGAAKVLRSRENAGDTGSDNNSG